MKEKDGKVMTERISSPDVLANRDNQIDKYKGIAYYMHFNKKGWDTKQPSCFIVVI